jgi:MerR family transcriptional regulator/heat shock protein HspR
VDTGQDRKKPLYSIGTVARILNVAVQTLRMYEREGLIVPSKSPGNQRLYSEADIERLRCIRRAITEEKIGIEGIRRLHSLIPCWDIIKCSVEDRRICTAFRGHVGGCWTHPHTKDICSTRDCRVCPVYELAVDCGNIKETIIIASRAYDDAVKA